jgi:hypothetical protein
MQQASHSLSIALVFGGLATRLMRQVASEAQIQMVGRHYYTLNSTVATVRHLKMSIEPNLNQPMALTSHL